MLNRVKNLALMTAPSTDDPYKKLSRREREILEIIHRRHQATVTEIIQDMESPPTRAAVRALMSIMERKGYVGHTKSGREFVYHPSLDRDTAAKSMFRNVIDNFFGGSLKNALATHLAEEPADYSEADLKELTEIIERARRK
ncbi:MAG: hypothetical protein CMO80_20265 [Verrucomicrobiales bacterium]|nr:hypothetical protein [Verrucomicrobiales bacterium]|tara:strand:- start:2952 stop:3377 length:426 start_codon:yes stop_codon:yes gene_type:complete